MKFSEIHQQVLKDIQTYALKTGSPIRLASGQMSNVYVNMKELSLRGATLKNLGQLMMQKLRELDPTLRQIAGVSVGGDPLVAAILIEATQIGWELEGLLVRKEAKSHGMSAGRCVEGGSPEASKKVYLVEDVVSTGQSSLQALEHLRKEGYSVEGVLCIVDREMNGLDKIKEQSDIPAFALFRLSELKSL